MTTPATTPTEQGSCVGKVFKLGLLVLALYVAFWCGRKAHNCGAYARLDIGSTKVLEVKLPDLTGELNAAKAEIERLKQEKTASEVASLQSQVLIERQMADLKIRLTRAELNRNTEAVVKAQAERDSALAQVVAITSEMTSLASVHSQSVARLRSEFAATLGSTEAELKGQIAVKDRKIADLNATIQGQRLDIQNLAFAAQGSAVSPNGLVNVEILAPAIPAREKFTVRFEQKRTLDFEVTVTNRNLETQMVVQVPPGLYTVTRLTESGEVFGAPVETMIWPGNHRGWFRFQNTGPWHAVVRNNPFIAFWNGVGERRSTVPNGQVRLTNGDVVAVENGRVVNPK